MQVHVTVAVQNPGAVDTDALTSGLPRGNVTVTATHGGLDITSRSSSSSRAACAACGTLLNEA